MTAMPPAFTQADVDAGAASYRGLGLKLYDSFVLGLNTRYAWKCPNERIVRLYDENVSANHLDIGVGTGYFLDHCRFPSANVRLGLMDLSSESLQHTARRLERFHPETYLANVLEPLAVKAPFDSVGLNYLLHCLPGTMQTKRAVFRNVAAVLEPGGVVFGATVLQGGVNHNWLARKMLVSLNEKRIFTNLHDDVAGLRDNLAAHFSEHEVEVVGGVGVFRGRL
jgi:SAM-dependent methyltransferase